MVTPSLFKRNTDGMKKTEFEGNVQNANHPFNSSISCTVYCYFAWWLKPSSCCPLLFFLHQNYTVKKDGTDGKSESVTDCKSFQAHQKLRQTAVKASTVLVVGLYTVYVCICDFGSRRAFVCLGHIHTLTQTHQGQDLSWSCFVQ